jgi:hypothetical protein
MYEGETSKYPVAEEPKETEEESLQEPETLVDPDMHKEEESLQEPETLIAPDIHKEKESLLAPETLIAPGMKPEDDKDKTERVSVASPEQQQEVFKMAVDAIRQLREKLEDENVELLQVVSEILDKFEGKNIDSIRNELFENLFDTVKKERDIKRIMKAFARAREEAVVGSEEFKEIINKETFAIQKEVNPALEEIFIRLQPTLSQMD